MTGTTCEHRPSSEYAKALEWFQRHPALTHVLQLGFAGEETLQHAAVIVREALRRESELDGWAALARIRDQFDCHELFVIGEDKPCGECPTCVASAALAARGAS